MKFFPHSRVSTSVVYYIYVFFCFRASMDTQLGNTFNLSSFHSSFDIFQIDGFSKRKLRQNLQIFETDTKLRHFLSRRSRWTRRERLDIRVICRFRYKIVGNWRSSGINGWQRLSDGKIEILITGGSNANFCSFIEPTTVCDCVIVEKFPAQRFRINYREEDWTDSRYKEEKRKKEREGRKEKSSKFLPLPPLLFPKGNNFVAETAGLKATAGALIHTREHERGDRRSV